MRVSSGALLLSAVMAITAVPMLAAKQGQDQESSSSSNSSSESTSKSATKPSSDPAEKSSKTTKSKKQQDVQTKAVETDTPLPPDSAEKDMQIAEYYVHKGDPDAAIPRLEEAIQEQPKLAKPRLMLAEVYEKKGDLPDAVKCYKEYLQVYPTAPDAKRVEKKIEKLSAQ